jgi:hypothetical protein
MQHFIKGSKAFLVSRLFLNKVTLTGTLTFVLTSAQCLQVVHASAALSPAVGEVSLVLGKAFILQGNGSSVPVKVGTQVRVSDVIETESNGHVHIRFVDTALVSVRPSSTLEIVRYDYDPQQPQNSAIKLNLVDGVAHAISGDAAKAARQNFRLNTPIAAIGVRGTDFTVSATQDSVRALVNQGAIVVAPFSSQCSADALGPCNSDAVELSGLSRQILELNASTTGISSTLLPMTSSETQAALAEAVERGQTEAHAVAKNTEKGEHYSDTVTSRAVNTRLASAEIKTQIPDMPGMPDIKVIDVKPDQFTPPTPLSGEVLTTNTQLVWGRWGNTNLQNERITIPYEIAQINKAVTVPVGDLGGLDYVLYRTDPNNAVIKPNLGVLGFNLSKAQVQYKAGGKAELMSVSGGMLTLDFDRSLFSTSLQLNHPSVGDYQFAADGRIYSGGFFHANPNSKTESMAGVVSVDGKEAGYAFEKQIESGSIEGLTLWSQKP